MSEIQPSLNVLRKVFGYEQFRGVQSDIIDTVVSGQNALVLMPTGGGKSLCYQIPSLVRSGVGIVISPLIALMKDQVDALDELGVRAGFINSSLSSEAYGQVMQQLRAGELDLLYLAPERFSQSGTLALLESLDIALFAIDEAHCVSQWGHDFRSDYLSLSLLQERFPHVPRIALTATADVATREEIASRLGLQDAPHFVSGFDRPNIQYRITQKRNARQQLLAFIRREHPDDAGIIYCMSRRKTEEVAAWLQQQGFDALPYHAGLSSDLRMFNQQRFLREDGVIIVATIAFGMGIDKPDVRFIVHLDLPKSVESYYQETGRAGRDGQPATAWMVYGLQDVIKLRQMLDSSQGNEQFKRQEQIRLDAMLGLCEITSCRRQALRHYFGESAPDACGNCDTCLQPPPTWDGTEAARKALSAVYRAGQRFGVSYATEILLGVESERILSNGHHRVSTFGIGRELDKSQWQSVFRQLIAGGYLGADHQQFGALYLTEKARPVLRGEKELMMREDVKDVSRASSRKRAVVDLLPEDQRLWEDLRQCRKQLADEHDVPPYVIFHDATLLDMVQLRPLNEQQLLAVNGVGQGKLSKFGQEFLRIINEHEYELG